MKTQYLVVFQCGDKQYHERAYKTMRGAINYVHDNLWVWRVYRCPQTEWAIERRVTTEIDRKLGFAFTTRTCTLAQSRGFSAEYTLIRERFVEAA